MRPSHPAHAGRRPRPRLRKSVGTERVLESNGPDIKIRGNSKHISERYRAMARDALASGDHVLSENYLQYAEHYGRRFQAESLSRPWSGRGTEAEGGVEESDGENALVEHSSSQSSGEYGSPRGESSNSRGQRGPARGSYGERGYQEGQRRGRRPRESGNDMGAQSNSSNQRSTWTPRDSANHDQIPASVLGSPLTSGGEIRRGGGHGRDALPRSSSRSGFAGRPANPNVTDQAGAGASGYRQGRDTTSVKPDETVDTREGAGHRRGSGRTVTDPRRYRTNRQIDDATSDANASHHDGGQENKPDSRRSISQGKRLVEGATGFTNEQPAERGLANASAVQLAANKYLPEGVLTPASSAIVKPNPAPRQRSRTRVSGRSDDVDGSMAVSDGVLRPRTRAPRDVRPRRRGNPSTSSPETTV